MSTEQSNQIASRTYRACEGDNERYWETRKATGVVLKDGSFLQTYPDDRHFYSLMAWKNHWSPLLSDPHFVGEEERQYALRKKNFAAISVFEPKLAYIRGKLEIYWRVIQQRPTAGPAEAQPPRATVECFTCPACGLGSGADHRMCICRSYNYSVKAWEIACGLRVPEEPVAAPVAAVEPATTTIPGEENFGSRTYRAYQTGRRLATVVVLDDGSIYQVWPLPKRNFYSLNAWKKEMRTKHGEIKIVGEDENIYRHYYAQHEDVIGNTYEVALRKTVENYGRIIKKRPTAEPEQIGLTDIPTPPPHFPYEAIAELRSKGATIEFTRECASMVEVSRSFHDFYRAYCLLTGESNERFTDEAISPRTIFYHLEEDGGEDSVVAYFDGLILRVRA